MNRKLYAMHRWLSLVVLLQLLVWSVSGLFFAVMSKESVMGTPVAGAHVRTLDPTGLLPASDLAERARAAGAGDSRKIELRGAESAPQAIVTGSEGRVRLDARTGAVLPVERDEAITIARRDQPRSPAVKAADKVERDPSIEYRDKPLPAWRVLLDDGRETAVWVDARTGDVTARRNGTWRIYDFLWSLHTMAYRDREDFRHPLLVAAAAFAVLTAVSGTVLWIVRAARAVRRRRAVSAPPAR